MHRSAVLMLSVFSPTCVALMSHTATSVRHPTARLQRSLAPRVAVATPLPIDAAALAPEDKWVASWDTEAFRKDVDDLGNRLLANQGPADVEHLKKMIMWSNVCAAVGLGTMWMTPNPVSVFCISAWIMSRWTMIAHHTCHGGYNKQDDGTGRFTSIGFAVGSVMTRCRDWFDWMLPEAWNVEHNNLHHYRLGEAGDPDLVERNLEMLRDIRLPRPLKYVVVAVVASIWKWWYYAPNTYKQLKIMQLRKEGTEIPAKEAHDAFTLTSFLNLGESKKYGFGFRDYIGRVMGPYLALRFFALPAPLLLLPGGRLFYKHALINLALADALSNIHSFIIIATNHCGDDLYKFVNSVRPKSGSFFMRAVTSGANFRTANGIDANGKARAVHGHTADLNDFMHGWLNYQIEHHAWPQLSMLSYQKSAPEMRAICEKHGVPYVQQNVFKRLKKTADVMVGATSMRPFDESWEAPKDAFKWK